MLDGVTEPDVVDNANARAPSIVALVLRRSPPYSSSCLTRSTVGAGLTVVLDSIALDRRVILLELGAADDGRLDREAARLRGK